MTKSAVRLAREALTVGRMALPPYGSRYSKHTYTQPQLFALALVPADWTGRACVNRRLVA